MNEVSTATHLADQILRLAPKDIIGQALDIVDQNRDFSIYREDPVSFCHDELHVEVITDDVRRMFDSVMENRVTIALSGTATGKTHGAACLALWFKKCFSGSQVIIIAPSPAEKNLKRKLWGEIQTLLINNPALFPEVLWTHGALILKDKRDPRSFIEGITIPTTGSEQQRETKISGDHKAHLFYIMDESDAIPDYAFHGVDGCMSGGEWNKLLCMLNPRTKGGEVHRRYSEVPPSASVVHLSVFNHPNVRENRTIVPGAVEREETVKRINEWSRLLSSDDRQDVAGIFGVPDFLVGEVATSDAGVAYPPLEAGKRKVTDPQMSYKVLGEYPPAGSNQLISEEWIDAAMSRYKLYVAIHGKVPPRSIAPLMGLDVADEGEDYNSLVSRYGGYVEVPERWQGIDPAATGVRAAEVYHAKRGKVLNVDGTGVGAGAYGTANRSFRWVCEYLNCGWQGQMTTNDLEKCPKCGKTEFLIRRYTDVKKVMVANSPTEKSEIGEFGVLRDQLWWACREWLRADPGAMLPDYLPLKQDLLVPTYEIKNGKVKVMSKKDMKKALGRSPDDGDALCLTFAYRIRDVAPVMI